MPLTHSTMPASRAVMVGLRTSKIFRPPASSHAGSLPNYWSHFSFEISSPKEMFQMFPALPPPPPPASSGFRKLLHGILVYPLSLPRHEERSPRRYAGCSARKPYVLKTRYSTWTLMYDVSPTTRRLIGLSAPLWCHERRVFAALFPSGAVCTPPQKVERIQWTRRRSTQRITDQNDPEYLWWSSVLDAVTWDFTGEDGDVHRDQVPELLRMLFTINRCRKFPNEQNILNTKLYEIGFITTWMAEKGGNRNPELFPTTHNRQRRKKVSQPQGKQRNKINKSPGSLQFF